MSTADDSSRRIAGSTTDTGQTDTRQTEPVSEQDTTRTVQPAGTVERNEPERGQRPADIRPAPAAKTSAAAVFALVFGLAALFCALTAILSPVAVVFGIIGLVLAFVGLKMAKRPGITGKGVAIGGLVTALLGLILGGVIIGGVAAVVNNDSQLDRLQGYLDDARDNLPSSQEVRNNIPGQ